MGLLLGTWMAIMYLPRVPDVVNCPVGYTGPGGRADGGKYANCTGGMAAFVDRSLLGPLPGPLPPTPTLVLSHIIAQHKPSFITCILSMLVH